MKNAAFTAIGILVLVTATTIAAQAQTSNSMKLVANIPFEFNVGDKALPAGQYIVEQINPSSDRAVLRIRSQHGDASAFVRTNTARVRETGHSALLFNRYGNQYFFSTAIVEGVSDAWQTPKSRAERSIAKELADLRPKTVTLTLTARKR